MSSSVVMREQYISHQTLKSDAPMAKLKQCSCCPYGYHIDLDFVNYCEKLAANARPQSDEQRLRREKRRQRKSMEVMLGVGEQLLQNYHNHQQHQQQARINCIPVVVEGNETDSPAQRNDRSPYEDFYNSCEMKQFEQHALKTSTFESHEKNEFVKDILFDVCSDFDRTFERTKKRSHDIGDRLSYECETEQTEIYGKCISRNEPSVASTYNVDEPKPIKTNHDSIEHSDITDASLRTHEPPSWWLPGRTERQHTIVVSNESTERHGKIEVFNDSQAQLQMVKEELARCVLRTRDLEEQVEQIPKLRSDLADERVEKRNLHKKLRETEENLARAEQNNSAKIDTPTSPLVRRSSIKSSTPIKSEDRPSTKLFSTQRVCATSLESLNFRFQNDSSPTFSILSQGSGHSNGNAGSARPARSQKDTGCMTNASITRDVGTVTMNQPLPKTRCIATNTTLKCAHSEASLFTEQDVHGKIAEALKKLKDDEASQTVKERLFTAAELQLEIKHALEKFEKEFARARLRNSSSVGVQCVPSAKQTRHIGTITDRPKTPPPPPPCIQHSVGIMAVVDTRNAYSTAKPDTKSISLDNIAAAIKTRSSGTNTIAPINNVPTERRSASVDRNDGLISLKSLDMMRSTTSLLSDKDHTDAAKPVTTSVSTQCALLTSPTVEPTPPVVQQSSVAIQNSPRRVHKSSQCTPMKEKTPPADVVKKQYRTEATDTRDLIRYHDSSNNTDAPPKKRDRLINTDRICTVNESTNTIPCKTIDHGTNPDPSQQRTVVQHDKVARKADIACGTEPIEVSPAKNCNTCLAKIEIKQQTLIKSPSRVDDAQQSDVSRIPRPTALISPRAERKKFTRQNTYTISPTTTTSFTHEISGISGNTASTAHKENNFHTTTSTANDVIISELIAETVNHHAQCPAETLLRITSASREGSPIKHRNTNESQRATGESSRVSAESSATETSAAQTCVNGASGHSTRRDNVNKPSSLTELTQPSTSKPRQKAKPTKEMQAALKVINDSLQKSNQVSTNLRNANKIVQIEWFRVSSTESAQPLDVEDYLDYFEEYSTNLLKYVVNLSDANGNTAMHYAISHGNFDVVSILLDSKVCCVNQTNNAGYTCVMLVSLAKLVSAEHHTVVQRLFQMSDVNIRAKKHNQTALMLAVSHGNFDMVQMLLGAGADINIQDEDGSTALMCAAEHGRIDIIKLLLAQPDCDSTIQDVDGSSALKISLEAGYRDIGVLLYAHEHMSRNRSPYGSLRRSSRGKKMSASLSSSTTTLGGGPSGSAGGGSSTAAATGASSSPAAKHTP